MQLLSRQHVVRARIEQIRESDLFSPEEKEVLIRTNYRELNQLHQPQS